MVSLGEPQVIAEWIDRFYHKKPCIWLKETDEIKEVLQHNQIIFVNSPCKEFIKKMSYILTYPVSTNNNGKTITFDDEEIFINNGCKVIFVFNKIEEVPPEVKSSGVFCLKMFEHKESKFHLAV